MEVMILKIWLSFQTLHNALQFFNDFQSRDEVMILKIWLSFQTLQNVLKFFNDFQSRDGSNDFENMAVTPDTSQCPEVFQRFPIS